MTRGTHPDDAPTAGADRAVIHVVDDDPAVLKALTRLLRAEGRAVAGHASAEAFLAAVEADAAADAPPPGCAVLDIELPGIDGIELRRRLAARGDCPPVIFLTGRGTIPIGVQAMKDGAVDFLTKPVDAAALTAAVSVALARDAEARAEARARADEDRRFARLTTRERQVMRLVVAGRLNKQIAGELGIAEKTAKVHRGRMMRKMGVRSVAELVRKAMEAGG